MRIVFRVDSSILIGIGHVMRCLTLADALKQKNANVIFISRDHIGNINKLIYERGYKVHCLKSNTVFKSTKTIDDNNSNKYSKWLGATWQEDAEQTRDILSKFLPNFLIVDHYALDFQWEQKLKKYCKHIMVIDDLADRNHVCDTLLDQTFGRKATCYQSFVPGECDLLLGTKYALLRPDFIKWREYSINRRKNFKLKQLLITLGGIDKDNITSQVIEALIECNLPHDIKILIIMGVNAPYYDEVVKQSNFISNNITVLKDVANMAEIIANSDLAIGAAGSTSWERCCLGLPTLMIITAENQIEVAKSLEKNGAAMLLSSQIKHNLHQIFEKLNGSILQELSTNAAAMVDGNGCMRVVDKMLNMK